MFALCANLDFFFLIRLIPFSYFLFSLSSLAFFDIRGAVFLSPMAFSHRELISIAASLIALLFSDSLKAIAFSSYVHFKCQISLQVLAADVLVNHMAAQIIHVLYFSLCFCGPFVRKIYPGSTLINCLFYISVSSSGIILCNIIQLEFRVTALHNPYSSYSLRLK